MYVEEMLHKVLCQHHVCYFIALKTQMKNQIFLPIAKKHLAINSGLSHCNWINYRDHVGLVNIKHYHFLSKPANLIQMISRLFRL